MNINETTTDFAYIESEIKKISDKHGLDYETIMNVFNMMMLGTDHDSETCLENIRSILSINGDKKALK